MFKEILKKAKTFFKEVMNGNMFSVSDDCSFPVDTKKYKQVSVTETTSALIVKKMPRKLSKQIPESKRQKIPFKK